MLKLNHNRDIAIDWLCLPNPVRWFEMTADPNMPIQLQNVFKNDR